MKALDQLMLEADELISSRTAGISKTASVSSDDEIFALAAQVKSGGGTSKTAAETVSDDDIVTVTEKLAHAVALVDTWQNLPTIIKLANFEESAKKSGYTPEQISSFLEKNAGQFQIKSVLE